MPDGDDPATIDLDTAIHMRPQEFETAIRLMNDPRFNGRTFEGVPPPDPGHDWVDDLGRTYDQMGDGKPANTARKPLSLSRSINTC
ncbi:hypothetical protein BH683_000710 [Williamsia sp. 1138]|nr:hypothetical protein BH683_000710 [Williamsia sp. 1138]